MARAELRRILPRGVTTCLADPTGGPATLAGWGRRWHQNRRAAHILAASFLPSKNPTFSGLVRIKRTFSPFIFARLTLFFLDAFTIIKLQPAFFRTVAIMTKKEFLSRSVFPGLALTDQQRVRLADMALNMARANRGLRAPDRLFSVQINKECNYELCNSKRSR